ncbi:bifunctional o-acetylhomoserine/o-acetylserine sulfhydrylase [Neomicrococcus aestuarii]|uniref:O-acetylhomoserine aminocarboxypropyltransferase n=1 Tax=Neomicrococcus aestuarii TaxID=556325 RepID=A0A1L2ZMI0_9MICC|nr:bifunctional o-acetylhomoserine/o-acetylserine sulfhydrylase [Neomicrococcus aestuarii]APF40410.1 O-acetylhomoserine aminocarboxypropyltransferase [Neomicrococcus aestuarii]
MSPQWNFETLQIHAGQTPDPSTGARALPIYLSTSFQFPSASTAAARFALQDLGPIYTRIGNPTQDVVEQRIAALEDGVGALLLASGQAATTFSILNLAEVGDHLVASPSLYGGTQNLFKHSLKKLGIEVTFVENPDDIESWKQAVKPNTKAFFAETVSNPRQDVLDIQKVADVAHEAGVPLIVDNTLATPFLIRPIEHGADIVVHSATKYLGGHGTVIGGVIVDSGNFDFGKDPEKYPGFNTPDESYNGLVFARDLGVNGVLGANLAYILKARVQLLRDLGSSLSPFNAFIIEQGLETLSLRMERHVANAQQVAEFLESHEQVESVQYVGLPSSQWHELGKKYAPKGSGAIVAFNIKGGKDAGQLFVDSLELHSHVANLGDVRSLVVHPASTTHSQLTEEEQLQAGVHPGLVRLSVGIENITDIINDLKLGFERVLKGRDQGIQTGPVVAGESA